MKELEQGRRDRVDVLEALKRRTFAEEEELLSVLSELMSETPPDMILPVLADWNRRVWLCVLMEGKCAE
jgi:hypothetical protein